MVERLFHVIYVSRHSIIMVRASKKKLALLANSGLQSVKKFYKGSRGHNKENESVW